MDYIVVHYTGNRGDTAAANAQYFARSAGLSASAHYFVDEEAIWQSVEEPNVAWHCGSKTYRHPACRNANSIGVEICMWDKLGGIRSKSIDRAAILVRELMSRYGIPADHVLRHYDVTGKRCPAPMVENPELWEQFQTVLKEEHSVRYQTLHDIPAEYGFRAIIGKLMDAGVIRGDGSGGQNHENTIDLSHDMIRLLIVHYRAGVFDDALSKAGISPEHELYSV